MTHGEKTHIIHSYVTTEIMGLFSQRLSGCETMCSLSLSLLSLALSLPQNMRIFTRIAPVNKINDILRREGTAPHRSVTWQNNVCRDDTSGKHEARLLYHEIIVIAFYASVIARGIFRENKGRGKERRQRIPRTRIKYHFIAIFMPRSFLSECHS